MIREENLGAGIRCHTSSSSGLITDLGTHILEITAFGPTCVFHVVMTGIIENNTSIWFIFCPSEQASLPRNQFY